MWLFTERWRGRKPHGQEKVSPEVFKRSKLTQTSPQTSCLRVSLRQGNPAGAERPVRDTCVGVCVVVKSLGLGARPGRLGGGFAGAHVPWNSEMACDGQVKTRRISPVCLRESAAAVSQTRMEKSVSGMDSVCVCVSRGGEKVRLLVGFVCTVGVCVHVRVCACVCVRLSQGHRPWNHLLQSALVKQAKATSTHSTT